MSVSKMLQLESSVLSSQAIKIPFEFTDKSSVPEGKNVGDSIVIKPITVRTWNRIIPLLSSIESEDLKVITSKDNEVNVDKSIIVLSKYSDLIFDILCLGIHNKKGDMPEWFRETLKDNCTWHDIKVLINAIIFRLQENSFINTITLLKSVSPRAEEELIALQQNLTTWSSPDSCSSQSVMKH